MSLRQQIIRGQALSWLLVLLVGALVFASVQRNAASTEERRETQAELVQVGAIRADIVDLETGLRGYLLTGATEFLEPFDRGRASIGQDITATRAFTKNDSPDSPQVTALRGTQEHIDQWFREVADPEITRHRQDPGAPSSLGVQLRGKQLIDEIRGLLDGYEQAEETELVRAQLTRPVACGSSSGKRSSDCVAPCLPRS